ncbi:MAG: cupin domain-containing protein [Alphaproteobacteria bacterium]|nr:cupin domain-containing protein [Alphaproteobacteria bacterium]
MTESDLERLAAEYALGTLDGAEQAAAEQRCADDPAFRALVEAWELRLSPLAFRDSAIAPPEGMFEAIEQRLNDAEAAPAGTLTVRAEQGGWETIAPGVELKILWENPSARRRALLMRMAKGAQYQDHRHSDYEECFVVEGTLSFGDLELRAGDFHVGFKDGAHPTAVSRDGCLLYLSTAM